MSFPANIRLQAVLDGYGIEDDYLHINEPSNYVVVLLAVIDGESNAAGVYATLDDVADSIGCAYENSNPREPSLVMDLRTGQRYSALVTHMVHLEPELEGLT